MNKLPSDSNGLYYSYSPDENVSWEEKGKITHEINYYYHAKYIGLPIIAHRSLGLDDRYLYLLL